MVNIECARYPELSWLLSGLAEIEEKGARVIKNLNCIKNSIRHIDVPCSVKGNTLWVGKLPDPVTLLPEKVQEFSIRFKDLNPEIE
jgi:hypothetical protein